MSSPISSAAPARPPAVAEKLGRKWIATDLGKFAIHTTRKRDDLGSSVNARRMGRTNRAFEILNLGKYGAPALHRG